jgi:hypothetical protein
MEQPGSHWTDFYETCYFSIFRKPVQKIQVSLKSDNNNGTLHEDLCTFMTIYRWILLRMRNVSDKSCRENQNTHFMFNNVFPKILPLWDNVEKYGTARQATDDNIIGRMRFACWITKATDTHSEYGNTSCFSTAKMVTRTHLNIMFIRTLSVLLWSSSAYPNNFRNSTLYLCDSHLHFLFS